MGAVRDRMDGDMKLRGLSQVTRTEYLRRVGHFIGHYRVSPEQLGAEDVRRYMLHLTEELHIGPNITKRAAEDLQKSLPHCQIAGEDKDGTFLLLPQ